MKLPLPKDFFQCPPLSDKDKACLRQVGRQASLDMVQLTQDPNAVTWQPVSFSNRNVRIFRGHDPTKPPSTITWCGITQLQATIEEVADLFRAETTEQYQDYCRMFSKDLIDGATLYTLTQPTAAIPRNYIGVKWHAAETAFVIRNRDFVNVEAQFDVEFEGRRGWVRVMRSVQLTCCPDFESLLGLVRAWHYCSGHLFLETDRPGYLAHTQLLQGTLNGNARGFVAVRAMKKRFSQMLDFRRYLCERRLSKMSFLDVNQFVMTAEQDQCRLCHRSFGMLRPKQHCRRCGHVVCSHCFKSWEIPINHKFVLTPICTKCTHQVIQVDDDFEVASVVSSIVRPIVLSGARLPAIVGKGFRP